MSPRAAWRLESLGFNEVYDYAAGKADWLAWGLPRKGTSAGIPTVGDLAGRDVPTCALGEKVSAVRQRTRAAGWDERVVTNDRQIILGLLRGSDLDADPDATAEETMRPGPTTYKPDTVAAEAERRIRDLLVATPDGALVGLLRREDTEREGEDAS